MNKIFKIFSLVLLSLSLGTISQAEVKMGISLSAIDMSPSAKEETTHQMIQLIQKTL